MAFFRTRKIGKARWLGLVLLLVAYSGNAFAANLELLYASAAASYAALGLSLASYQKLSCVSPDAAKHLGNYQSNSGQVFNNLSQSYQNYMAYVKAPMSGDGRCDGGFSAVVVESEKRREKTAQLQQQVGRLQANQNLADQADFTGATIDMPDESDDQSCAGQADKLYDQVAANTLAANTSMLAFQSGVASVEAGFRSYVEMNKKLGGNCGSMASGLGSLVSADISAAPAANGGQTSREGYDPSGISGKAEPVDVAAKVAGAGLSASGVSASGAAAPAENPGFSSFAGDLGTRGLPEATAKGAAESFDAHASGGAAEAKSGIGHFLDQAAAMAEGKNDSHEKTGPQAGDGTSAQASNAITRSLASADAPRSGASGTPETYEKAAVKAGAPGLGVGISSSLDEHEGIAPASDELFEKVHRVLRAREKELRP